jgi:hypothetical protein
LLYYKFVMTSHTVGVPEHCPFWCDLKCQKNSMWIDMGIAGVFSGLTIIISLINIYLHLCHFNNPYFQSKIISIEPLTQPVILLMAPFYCITSMSSIIWPVLPQFT